MNFQNTREFAQRLDQDDALKSFRERFYFPLHNGQEVVYFTGNSLGLQPRSTQDNILRELEDWATYGVEGHFHARYPWYHYKEFLKEPVAKLLGAGTREVVVMNSLTVNLHLLLISFYRPDSSRYKILCEYDAFPSDLYALESQAKFHGYDPNDAIIYLKPRAGEFCLRTEDIQAAIAEAGTSLATVMLGAVNYYTGQFFELDKITQSAHQVGATCGFNLAHAAGNVPLDLHAWNVDYACFCSYKYLNAGPGGVSGIFVHENNLGKNLPQFAGWWGNDPETRFQVPRTFQPVATAAAWALSNDPVLPMAALKASLDLFEEAGFDRLREKSIQLTAFLQFIVDDINSASGNVIRVITPREPDRRGCQLSLVFSRRGREVFSALSAAGVISDWREPDVIRLAPVPLYNSFEDIYRFGEILGKELAATT